MHEPLKDNELFASEEEEVVYKLLEILSSKGGVGNDDCKN